MLPNCCVFFWTNGFSEIRWSCTITIKWNINSLQAFGTSHTHCVVLASVFSPSLLLLYHVIKTDAFFAPFLKPHHKVAEYFKSLGIYTSKLTV